MKREQIDRLLSEIGWMRGLAGRLTRDDAEADDLVQDTWVSALRSPTGDVERARPWLQRVMRNLAANRARGRGRRETRETKWAQGGPDAHEDERGLAEETIAALRTAVARLSAAHRDVIYWRYFCDMTPKQIAAEQDIPAATVRSQLKRALDALRNDLDHKSGGDREAWLAGLGVWLASESATAGPASMGSASQVAQRTGAAPGTGVAVWLAPLTILAVLIVGILSVSENAQTVGEGEPGWITPLVPADEAGGGAVGFDAGAPRPLTADAPDTPGGQDVGGASVPAVAPFLQLHLLDANTRRPLDDIEVVAATSWDGRSGHPGAFDESQRVARAARSPVGCSAASIAAHELGDTGTAILFVRGSGTAWQRIRVALGAGGTQEILLQPGAELEVGIRAPKVRPDLWLRVTRANSPRRLVFLERRPSNVAWWASRFDGVPLGALEVALLDSPHATPRVLAREIVDLGSGPTPRVDLRLERMPPTPPPVAQSGWLEFPTWPAALNVSLTLHPVGGPALAVASRTLTPRLERSSAAGAGRVRMRWSHGSVTPGAYEVRVAPFDARRVLELGLDAGSAADIDIPVLSRLDVDVIDAVTRVPLQPKGFGWWRADQDRAADGSHARASRDQATGFYPIVTEPGRLVMSFEGILADDDAYRFGRLVLDVPAGESRATMELRAAVELVIRTFDGDTERPFDDRVQSFHIESPSGDGFVVRDQMQRASSVYLSAPGLYRVTVVAPPGFAPLAPRDVWVSGDGPNRLDLHLTGGEPADPPEGEAGG
jgi:RNA polymerase sigma-70 factor (ECF subfamily)